MRTVSKFIGISFFLSLLVLTTSYTNAVRSGKMETIVIKTNIYCSHCLECETCGQLFDTQLAYERGIRLVVVDDKAMTITVTYNPKQTNPDAIRSAISKLGYDADDVKADPASYEKLDGCCKK